MYPKWDTLAIEHLKGAGSEVLDHPRMNRLPRAAECLGSL
jgi:hypothetical protein